MKVFADIIRSNVGDLGYAIRYGGDEFVVVIPEEDENLAEKIAGNIQRQLKEASPQRIAVEGLKLTSSVGIASYENAGASGLESALMMADRSLYYVKSREKGKVARWSQIRNQI